MQGQPIFYYVDGPPLGQTFEAQMLGHECNFSLLPLRMLCQFEDLNLIPVTSRYHSPSEVYVRFLDPIVIPAQWAAGGAERLVLEQTIDRLTAHLRELAPEQVLARMMPYRERLAQEMDAARTERRNKPAQRPDPAGPAT